MIPLNRLKKELEFNKELTNVVDVLKGIAAAKLHTLQKQLALFDKFFQVAGEFLQLMDVRQIRHPFVQPRNQTTGVLMITSDAGFLGGLTNQIVAAGVREAGASGVFTVVGERGAGCLQDLRRSCTVFPGIDDAARTQQAMMIRDHVIEQVWKGQCGRLVVVYAQPVSFAFQKVTVETLLPCSAWAQRQANAPPPADQLWESDPAAVLEYVAIQWIGHRLDEILALSRLSELAARVTHLEGSYQELQQRGKRMKLQYFRARHEIIDRSIREIFAAQLLNRHRAAELAAAEHEVAS